MSSQFRRTPAARTLVIVCRNASNRNRLCPSALSRGGALRTLGLLVYACVLIACDAPARVVATVPPPPRIPEPVYDAPCVVTRIYDGDTFACTPSPAAAPLVVRLLYVDAPETAQRLGAASTAILRDALPVGHAVGLHFDVDSLDPFGRTLAWIETTAHENLNVWLAMDGWATDLIIAPNTAIAPVVRAAVDSARHASRGLWARGFAACLPVSFRRGDCND